jgi:hypothetical protein
LSPKALSAMSSFIGCTFLDFLANATKPGARLLPQAVGTLP